MLQQIIESFVPFDDSTLAASWEWHLRHNGYASRPLRSFWDTLSEHATLPEIVTKTIHGKMTSAQLRRVTMDSYPIKILLVEGRPIFENLTSYGFVAATARAGIYVRSAGWLVIPLHGEVELDDPLAYTGAWFKDAEGDWVKLCPSCGEAKMQHEYYLKSRTRVSPRRDPYRNPCKECLRARRE